MLALTFDDLPYAARPFPEDLTAARRVTDRLLAGLSRRGAPAAVFVNEMRLEVPDEREARIELLRQWVEGGHVLGNHTYSHVDLNRVSAEEFEAEIARGDVVSRDLMRVRGPYPLYFRHPYTHTGDTREKMEQVAAFLAARGYAIAPHTIDSADYVFNLPYVEAIRSGDEATARRLRSAYLDFLLAATDFAERIAPQVIGRDIPHVVLLHANDINADCIDALLEHYAERGHRFVSLERALEDPAYATRSTLVTPYGPTWLWRWRKTLNLDVSFAGDPEPPGWVTTAYARLQREP